MALLENMFPCLIISLSLILSSYFLISKFLIFGFTFGGIETFSGSLSFRSLGLINLYILEIFSSEAGWNGRERLPARPVISFLDCPFSNDQTW